MKWDQEHNQIRKLSSAGGRETAVIEMADSTTRRVEIITFRMPDGTIRSMHEVDYSGAVFSLGVMGTLGQVYAESEYPKETDSDFAEIMHKPHDDVVTIAFGVEIDGKGQAKNPEREEFMRSGEYKKRGATLLFPGVFGVPDFRKGEVCGDGADEWIELRSTLRSE